MTEVTTPKSPATAEQFTDEIREQLKYTQNVTTEQATPADVYVAASRAVRSHLAGSWFKTRTDTMNGNTRAIGYLSAELLIGKQLHNALLSADLTEQFDKAVEALGFKIQGVVDAGYELDLGNGGLGRLAACSIDSLASLGVPAFGYGIQYKHGIPKQELDEDDGQIGTPDYQLASEGPWGHIDYNRDQEVSFGDEIVESANGTKTWQPAWSVRAVSVDYLVPDYKFDRVSTLYLWSAKSYDEFNLLAFDRSEYMGAVAPQAKAENISKIFYPEDSTKVGKELRLEQQYFLVSASLHDAIRVFYPGQSKPDLTTFPNKIVFQLNDTHPVIGIPELMRILTNEYGYDWNTAWSITTKTFNYTYHILLPKALEIWPASLVGELLPRRPEIIGKINTQFKDELKSKGVDKNTIKDMAIYISDAVRMTYLATCGGSHANDVAELHSQFLKDVTLKNFSDVYPDKFTDATNGMTPRRFVELANPHLPDLITEGLGTDEWLSDLEMLRGLKSLARDDEFVKKLATVKKANKVDFAACAKREYSFELGPDTMLNTMVKCLHEYKHQSLEILSVISTYAGIKSGKVKAGDVTPRTMFFGTKVAPSYYLARMTIQFINSVSCVVNNGPDVKDKLTVYFSWNCNVRLAQHLIPTTDLDEQISQAGKETSDTDSMKSALNGAVAVGTLDGTNVKIRERVDARNFFLFGMTIDEVEKRYAEGYNPTSYYEADPRLKHIVDMVADGIFSSGDRNACSPLVANWLTKDWFMALTDFSTYMGVQSKTEALYTDELEWNHKALLNAASSGYFSSGHSMEDYLGHIWHTTPLA